MLIDNITDSFFNDDIAVDAIYTPAGGQPSAVSVIFDRDYLEAPQFGDTGVETRQISITVKTSDFQNAKQGDTVEIDSVIYYIINTQFSEGISIIILSKNQP